MFKSATNVADANVCMNYTWTNLNILLYELSIKLYIKPQTHRRKESKLGGPATPKKTKVGVRFGEEQQTPFSTSQGA